MNPTGCTAATIQHVIANIIFAKLGNVAPTTESKGRCQQITSRELGARHTIWSCYSYNTYSYAQYLMILARIHMTGE
jgi:hypothetical protein